MDRWDSEFLDSLNVVSFLIGMANYSENVNQSQLQQVVTKAVKSIHHHLQEQDQKMDLILSRLEELSQ